MCALQMWWCIAMLGCLHAAVIAGAYPLVENSRQTLWGLHPLRPPPEDNPPNDNNHLQYLSQLLDSGKDTNDYYSPSTKRAFTLLSRWHPFSTLSRNVPSIREQNRQIFNDLDIETRGIMRPVGQPLRWG